MSKALEMSTAMATFSCEASFDESQKLSLHDWKRTEVVECLRLKPRWKGLRKVSNNPFMMVRKNSYSTIFTTG